MRAATKAPARRHRRLFYHNGQDRAKATAAAAAAAPHCRDGTPSRLLHQIAATETTAISRVAARGVQDKGISPSPAATHTSSVYLLLAHGRASSFVTTAALAHVSQSPQKSSVSNARHLLCKIVVADVDEEML